jgi:hypothetical protein
MARPHRLGLDYWPMDVDYYNDPKFQFIRAKCGLKGEWICFRLFAAIYRNGYFTPWAEDDQILFAKNLNEGIRQNQVCQIVDEAIKRELFSEKMLLENSILTSRGIQKRYVKACTDSRRTVIEINPKFDLLTQKPDLLPSKQEFIPSEIPQKEKEREIKGKERESKKISHPFSVFEKPFFEDLNWFKEKSSLLHCTVEELQQSAQNFWDKNQITGKSWPSLTELKNHFMNWHISQPVKPNYLRPTLTEIE